MNLNNQQKIILSELNHVSLGKGLEFEAIFGSTGFSQHHQPQDHEIEYEHYLHILQHAKYSPDYKYMGSNNELNVFLHKSNDVNDRHSQYNLRLRILQSDIPLYCKTGSIQQTACHIDYKTTIYVDDVIGDRPAIRAAFNR